MNDPDAGPGIPNLVLKQKVTAAGSLRDGSIVKVYCMVKSGQNVSVNGNRYLHLLQSDVGPEAAARVTRRGDRYRVSPISTVLQLSFSDHFEAHKC